MHYKTPRLVVSDPRGLSVRTVDYYRGEDTATAQARISRSVFDTAGRAIEQWDPRLWALHKDDPRTPANLTTVYSLSAKALKTVSVDAGMRLQLFGLADELLRSWDGRGTRQETLYDRLLRPLAVLEQDTCAERFEYAGADDANIERNQCGQLIRHDDPAGTLFSTEFDIRGHCIRQARRFAVDPVQPDWPLLPEDREPLLESQSYETLWRFDSLDDWREQRDAKGNRQQHRYTLDGRVRESCLKLNGESEWHTVVSAIEYNAAGNIERQVAGNDVITTLRYRPEDGRLMERKDRNGKLLQWLIHDYDRMGNVLSITDAAMPVRYFANQRIDPVRRYGYDSLYQLIQAFGWEVSAPNKGPLVPAQNDPAAVGNYQQRYEYDAGGNLLKRTHVGARSPGLEMTAALYSNRCLPFRPNGQPPTQEQIAAAFDANGNLLELSAAAGMTWDWRNQLQSVFPVERDCEVYVYDGHGQRVRKVRSLHTNARTVVYEVRYLPGLESRINQGTGETLEVMTLQTGLNTVRVLHWVSVPPGGIANDQYRYSLVDHQDSCTVELADDGSVISQEVFYSYGETAWSEDVDSYKTLRYSGKERDATGLHYYGLRYYAGWLQRWINPDPGGAIDGPNRYRAMRNNPLFYRDVDGLETSPNQNSEDSVYYDLAEVGVVHYLQAYGMQPIRNYFADSPDPATLAYRSEIPIALEQLGAGGNRAFTNTHQAHVFAAARTDTNPPSGGVLYHTGEAMSGLLNYSVGEGVTSLIMGPMSEAFNSPVGSPEVLAARRQGVAYVIQIGGRMASYSRNPALSAVGSVAVTYARLMRVSEAQTQMQYQQLTHIRVAVVEGPPAPIVDRLTLRPSAPAQVPMFDTSDSSSRQPSALAMRLLAVGFAANEQSSAAADAPIVPVRRRSRSS
ncbi:RHS repeat-associated core domain-containing protein [Pseudomonas sp. 6D_7.1_Bac1]|uniref:RHS repeat-associated core domain-containing protein n=1 Tax=Pseudomonas sp. 6D_7.1_Bac1 TaxID=2971615 RepID=UPI0021C844F3|nr:RHS repeat-associated core domain-containing protein [Pseudomonas sp. 6D_7.1_Bac1]MCU1749935.1 RHS repeat-associated core domain-containing protein [Pseudomonas sp. 6D_7.1_Bac1]